MKYILNKEYLITNCFLSMPEEGNWTAKIEVDTTQTLSDSLSFTFIDTVFNGTIINKAINSGHSTLTIIGGKGLNKVLDQKQYQSVIVKNILDDIARETSHTISSSISTNILNQTLPAWIRIKSRAKECLETLTNYIDCIWQVLPDGTLWIGKQEYKVSNTTIEVLDRFDQKWVVYNEEVLLRPLISILGNNVKKVEYNLDSDELSATLLFFDPIEAIYDIGSQEMINIYRSTYRCRVVNQNSDGSLDLQPDPPNKLFDNGLSGIKYCPPIPNLKLKVKVGTYCILQFLNGDPSYPRVIAWDLFTKPDEVFLDADKVIINSNEKPVARKDDTINAGYLTFNPGMSGATLTYSSSAGTIALNGKITSGSSTVNAG